MRRLVHLTIILILLTITFGTASCNNSQLTSRAPGLSAYEKQSASDTDNTTSQSQISTQGDQEKIGSKKISEPIGGYWHDPLTEIVMRADLIVLGTITDNRTEVVTVMSEHPGKFAYTYYTLLVEEVVKGDPSLKEVIIRDEQGYLGNGIYQYSTGGRAFNVSDYALLGLMRDDDIYVLFAAPYGDLGTPIDSVNSDFWVQSKEWIPSHTLQEIMGRICRILIINGTPPNPLSKPYPIPIYEPASPPKP